MSCGAGRRRVPRGALVETSRSARRGLPARRVRPRVAGDGPRPPARRRAAARPGLLRRGGRDAGESRGEVARGAGPPALGARVPGGPRWRGAATSRMEDVQVDFSKFHVMSIHVPKSDVKKRRPGSIRKIGPDDIAVDMDGFHVVRVGDNLARAYSLGTPQYDDYDGSDYAEYHDVCDQLQMRYPREAHLLSLPPNRWPRGRRPRNLRRRR